LTPAVTTFWPEGSFASGRLLLIEYYEALWAREKDGTPLSLFFADRACPLLCYSKATGLGPCPFVLILS
jgi:hypothetical protein